jgi:type I restriction enzyme R subunit
LLGQFRHLHTDIYGNREFVEQLRNRGKFFDHEEKRERDLILIDYDDPANNVYEVTEEWAFHNGHYGTREDVVFLINGIPVLVIECKNANKDEAIALGVDQISKRCAVCAVRINVARIAHLESWILSAFRYF